MRGWGFWRAEPPPFTFSSSQKLRMTSTAHEMLVYRNFVDVQSTSVFVVRDVACPKSGLTHLGWRLRGCARNNESQCLNIVQYVLLSGWEIQTGCFGVRFGASQERAHVRFRNFVDFVVSFTRPLPLRGHSRTSLSLLTRGQGGLSGIVS